MPTLRSVNIPLPLTVGVFGDPADVSGIGDLGSQIRTYSYAGAEDDVVDLWVSTDGTHFTFFRTFVGNAPAPLTVSDTSVAVRSYYRAGGGPGAFSVSGGNLSSFSGTAGPPGPTGPAGATGAAGASPITTTTGSFTQPLSGSTVNVSVATTVGMAPGAPYFIAVGGAYTVSSALDGSHVLMTNTGAASNASPGATVGGGSTVAPSGFAGPAGPAGGAEIAHTYIRVLDPADGEALIPIYQNATDAPPFTIAYPFAFKAIGAGTHAYPGGHSWDITLIVLDAVGAYSQDYPLISGANTLTPAHLGPGYQWLGGELDTTFALLPGYAIFARVTPALLGGFTAFDVTFLLSTPFPPP